MNQREVIMKKLQQYDTSFEYDLRMYDNLPYVRDTDRCNKNTICMESGNILKSYRISQSQEPYVYKAPAMTFPAEPVQNLSSYNNNLSDNNIIDEQSSPLTEPVTDEQLDNLLMDSDSSQYQSLAS